MKKNEFEILAPAGSFDILKAVLEAGADAVYLGGSQYGARAYANNFNEEELLSALDYAHLRKKKIYLTVNTLMKNQEIGDPLYRYLLPYYRNGLDAVIVQDFGAVSYIREQFPDLPVHASTQMTITGADGARLMKELGMSRVVTAREMSLEEIAQIHKEVPIEIETFVHGALCYCYSGQCLMSSMLGGRSGNRGRCAQPCRLPYAVYDEKHKEVCGDSYVLSLKDLCEIEQLPAMNKAGIYSLKIEGRMKQVSYAAGVVSYYRKYVDQFMESENGTIVVSDADKKAIFDLGNRCGFTDAYFTRQNGRDMVTFSKPNHQKSNDALQQKIEDSYAKKQTPVFIDGVLSMKKGKQAGLTLLFGEKQITCQGDEVLPAEKKPLSKEDVEARFRKTGETSFEFQTLQIDLDKDAFLPVGAMNRLRREALSALSEALLMETRRNASDAPVEKNKEKTAAKEKKQMRYTAAVIKRELLPVLLSYDWLTDIDIDADAYAGETAFFQALKEDAQMIHAVGKKAHLILPVIFRKKTADFYKQNAKELLESGVDGLLLCNYEQLQIAKENWKELELRIDHNLYTYNDRAVWAFEQYGISGNTVPIELNGKEICHRDNEASEMILYGYYPLMVSAQCINGNTKGCDKRSRIMWLKDRYKKEFPVINHCSACYNTIYNSLPVQLFGQYGQLKKAGILAFRLQFTIESKKQVKAVLDQFEAVLYGRMWNEKKQAHMQYTNGHYKRGVE